jgi:hypothetical protein
VIACDISFSNCSWCVYSSIGDGLGTAIRPRVSPTCAPDLAPGESVHAIGSPLLMSSIVKTPASMARSPHRRNADQNAVLHSLWQKRCGLPPRRGRNDLSHHSQIIVVLSIRGFVQLGWSHCASHRERVFWPRVEKPRELILIVDASR